ncbi:hypothetical protein [Yoonia sp. I 8.24]|uniref:hypothetical protein n=1 Tax=Yoonia sp. I 8.24 TaxID=1537229 RepID=UPI001EDCCB06|nr:hypothetical protein [Yoonia sp. I 8.24]MCG3268761.1 hypothetical protein [Yoonia sp. I 8.24]
MAYIFGPSKVIEISPDQIDQALKENIPYEVDSLATTVTVHEAKVYLTDNGQIQLHAQFEARGFTLEGIGSAQVNSAVRYERGKFYLTDLKRDHIQFELSENSTETVSDVRATLDGILRRETEEANESGDPERIAAIERRRNYIETEMEADALAALDTFLGTFPVYNLQRAGGALTLAALAIDTVEITHDKIFVTLSLQTLILRVAGGLATTFFLLVVAFGQLALGRRKPT